MQPDAYQVRVSVMGTHDKGYLAYMKLFSKGVANSRDGAVFLWLHNVVQIYREASEVIITE